MTSSPDVESLLSFQTNSTSLFYDSDDEIGSSGLSFDCDFDEAKLQCGALSDERALSDFIQSSDIRGLRQFLQNAYKSDELELVNEGCGWLPTSPKPIHVACNEADGGLEMVQLLYEFGARLDALDYLKRTPLMLAAQAGGLLLVKYLVNKGCSVFAKCEHGRTALHYACGWNRKDVIAYLLERKSDINQVDYLGSTPLIIACQSQLYHDACIYSVESACAILESISRFEMSNLRLKDLVASDMMWQDRVYHLSYCSTRKNYSIVQELVAAKARLRVTNRLGKSALDYACESGYSLTLCLLLELEDSSDVCAYRVDFNNSSLLVLLLSMRKDVSLTAVQKLISNFQAQERDDLICKANKLNQTPLYWALKHGNDAIADYLLSLVPKQWVLNQKILWRLAYKRCHVSIIRKLAEIGFDISSSHTENGTSVTALSYACRKGLSEVAEYLIDANAVNRKDFLMVSACKNCSVSTVRKLIQRGCRLNATDINGHSALMNAVMHGKNEVALHLIRQGASIGRRNVNSELLMNACQINNLSVLKEILSRGNYFNKKTVLHALISNESKFGPLTVCAAKVLLSKGAHSDNKDCAGRLPFERTRGELRPLLKEAYLKSRFALLYAKGVTVPKKIKVCTIGDAKGGKTSLIQSLQRLQTPEKLLSTAGIGIHDTSIEFAGDLVICDFAGQPNFYKTHSLFVSQRTTVFLLVVDLTKSESAIYRSCSYWLSFLKCSLNFDGSTALVVLIGSRADETDGDSLYQVATMLRIKFSRWFCISENIFVLDCRDSDSHEIRRLREHIKELKHLCTKDVTVPVLVENVVTQLLPKLRKLMSSSSNLIQEIVKADLLPWQLLDLLDNLQTSRNYYFALNAEAEENEVLDDFAIDLDKVPLLDRHYLCRGLFLAMIDHVVYHGLNKELQRLTLEFLRGLGMIIEINDQVIVDPNWLCCSIIGPVMSPDDFPVHVQGTVNGIVCVGDIKGALEEFSRKHGTPRIAVEEAIKILCSLEICYAVPSKPNFYQFPALIQEKRRAEIWTEDPTMRVYVGRRIQCEEETDIITPGTLPFLQTRTTLSPGQSCVLWRGGIVLSKIDADSNCFIQGLIELNVQGRAIDVVTRGPTLSERECWQFLLELKGMVQKAMDDKSPGTSVSEELLVLSRRDMEDLAETPIAYPRHTVLEAQATEQPYPAVGDCSSPVARRPEYLRDLLVVCDDHVAISLPRRVKLKMFEMLDTKAEIVDGCAKTLRICRATRFSCFQDLFNYWSRNVHAPVSLLADASRRLKETDVLQFLKGEKVINGSKEGNKDADTEFSPWEASKQPELSASDIVKDWHVGIIKNEITSREEDVVTIGQKILGCSKTAVENIFSDNPNRRTSTKLCVVLHHWMQRDGDRATIGKLLEGFKAIEKDRIAERIWCEAARKRSLSTNLG